MNNKDATRANAKRYQDISFVKKMCTTNMGGGWELEHRPFEGGYYEQPAVEMDWIHMIISCVNQALDEKDDKGNK